jgi:hypothetical protein
MTIQEAGGTARAIEAGIEIVRELVEEAARVERQTVSASHLTVGLQCGGSDGWSGVTANPALGAAVDLLVAHGGSAMLSETPEIWGAEHLLLRRATSQGVADKLNARLEWWRAYADKHGMELNNNPSPGNLKGGLTTILEKSLGAVAKSGSTPADRRHRLCRAAEDARPDLHGQPRLRPLLGDRPDRLGRQSDRLHHGPRLGLRGQARAVDQGRLQRQTGVAGWTRTWTSTPRRS